MLKRYSRITEDNKEPKETKVKELKEKHAEVIVKKSEEIRKLSKLIDKYIEMVDKIQRTDFVINFDEDGFEINTNKEGKSISKTEYEEFLLPILNTEETKKLLLYKLKVEFINNKRKIKELEKEIKKEFKELTVKE